MSVRVTDESFGTSDEIEQTLGKIRQRDQRLDAAELPQERLDASSVADIIKEKSKPKDREERKRNGKRIQSPTSTVGDKVGPAT